MKTDWAFKGINLQFYKVHRGSIENVYDFKILITGTKIFFGRQKNRSGCLAGMEKVIILFIKRSRDETLGHT